MKESGSKYQGELALLSEKPHPGAVIKISFKESLTPSDRVGG